MRDGHAIHGSYEVKNLGKPLSHGCVRISPENAATLYALVAKNGLENTQVVLTGTTPGGEYKVASPARPGSRYSQAGYGRYETGDSYYTQPQTRLGFFGNAFGGPSYNGAQSHYGPTPVYRTARVLKNESWVARPFVAFGRLTELAAQNALPGKAVPIAVIELNVDNSTVTPRPHSVDYRAGGMDQSFNIDLPHARNLPRVIVVYGAAPRHTRVVHQDCHFSVAPRHGFHQQLKCFPESYRSRRLSFVVAKAYDHEIVRWYDHRCLSTGTGHVIGVRGTGYWPRPLIQKSPP